MSFLNDVVLPNTQPNGSVTPPPTTKTGFLNSVTVPDAAGQAQASKIADLSKKETAAKANAAQQNSIVGLIKSAATNPVDPTGISSAFMSGIDQANKGSVQANTAGSNLVQRGEGVLNFGGGLIGAATAPLTAAIAPLIKAAGEQVAKVPAISEYGKAVAHLPNQDQGGTADRILTAISNFSAIAGVAVGGIKGGIKAPIEAVKPTATKLPVSGTSTETPVPFANKYEQPKTIEMGTKPRETLPTIQVQSKAAEMGKIPGFKYEGIKSPYVQPSEASVRPVAASAGEKVSGAVDEAPVNATGDMVNARASASAHAINEAIVERGSPESLLKDMAPTEVTSYKSDRVASLDLLDTNMKLAESAAKGEVTPQSLGVKNPVILFNEVLKRAQREDNIPLMRELQKSPYASISSESGKGLGAHGFSKPEHSTIDLAREIEQVRSSVLDKKGESSKTFIGRGKKQIARTTTKDMVRDFINSIPDC